MRTLLPTALLQDLDALLAASLSEEALSRPDTTAADLSLLLLEGARVMRLIVRGGKVLAPAGGEHSIAVGGKLQLYAGH